MAGQFENLRRKDGEARGPLRVFRQGPRGTGDLVEPEQPGRSRQSMRGAGQQARGVPVGGWDCGQSMETFRGDVGMTESGGGVTGAFTLVTYWSTMG